MKKIIILQAVLAMLTLVSCNNSQHKTEGSNGERSVAETTDSTAVFESFSEHFSTSSAFAYTEMNGRKVLLVS